MMRRFMRLGLQRKIFTYSKQSEQWCQSVALPSVAVGLSRLRAGEQRPRTGPSALGERASAHSHTHSREGHLCVKGRFHSI